MHALTHRIDDIPRPFWIALMVMGFIVFWPIGLAILAYLIWSRKMGCGRYAKFDKMERFARWQDQRGFGPRGWGPGFGGPRPSGNAAFDEYRQQTLQRLEEEEREFRDYLERLRMAKDRAEFDQFMRERQNRPAPPAPPAEPAPGQG